MDLFSSFMFVQGKSIMYIMIAFKFPSLPVSIFNQMYVILDCILLLGFAIITDLILWKLKTFDLTMSNSCVDTSLLSSSQHML